jgi:hypothetical protein
VLLGISASLAAYPTDRLTAQVGYEPNRSPYRDAPASSGPMFFAGYLSGGRGNVPVGVSDGNTWGVRYNFAFGSTSIILGGAYGQTTRRIVDPFVATKNNTSGLINCDVVVVDATLQMAITGPKTWHGLAPYIGATLGAAIGSELPQDSSGYSFGTKFTFGPVLGAKYYIGKKLSLNADFRALFWRLSYPTQYKEPNVFDGGRVLSVDAATNHWTTHPWLSVGLGWAF